MSEEKQHGTQDADTAPLLRVGRAGLLEVFRLLLSVGKPRKAEQVVLSFDGNCLHFDLSGMTATAAAKGSWPCQVRVRATALLSLAKVPPAGDPLVLRVEDGRIHFGPTFSCACDLQSMWKAAIQLPLNYDAAMLLGLKLRYTPEQIEQSGLKETVANAEKNCMRHVSTAAVALAPYLVKQEDIRALVDQSLRESGLLGKI
jgi:hypothetical protein